MVFLRKIFSYTYTNKYKNIYLYCVNVYGAVFFKTILFLFIYLIYIYVCAYIRIRNKCGFL